MGGRLYLLSACHRCGLFFLSAGRKAGHVPRHGQQGIAYHEGFLYITADDGDAEDREVDNLWRVAAGLRHSAAYVTHELAFDDFRQVGEMEGITFDGDAGEMIVLANRGKRIVLGMPQGLYPGYDREVHELYVYQWAR